jgi:RHS repeat-associated protein
MVDWTAAGDVAAGSEEVLHYVRDALGSVVGLLDAGEPDATPEPVPPRLVERYDYDPYGKTYIEHWDATAGGGSGAWVRHAPDEPSAYGNPFMWTGQRQDVAIGLYHFPFRTYSPRLGRWLQRDPLGYVDGVNLYAYAGSSPTNLVDPLGFTSLLPEAPGSDYDPMLGPFGGDDEIGPPLPPKPEPCDDGTDNPNGDEEDGTGRGGPNGTGDGERDAENLRRVIESLLNRHGLNYLIPGFQWWSYEQYLAFLKWLQSAIEAMAIDKGMTTDPVNTLIRYLTSLPDASTPDEALANVDAIWGKIIEYYSGMYALELFRRFMDDAIGLDAGWDKLDYGEGADHLRHFAWAAAVSNGHADYGAAVYVIGVVKELGDAGVHLVQEVFGGNPDWDGMSDLDANGKGLHFSEKYRHNRYEAISKPGHLWRLYNVAC